MLAWLQIPWAISFSDWILHHASKEQIVVNIRSQVGHWLLWLWNQFIGCVLFLTPRNRSTILTVVVQWWLEISKTVPGLCDAVKVKSENNWTSSLLFKSPVAFSLPGFWLTARTLYLCCNSALMTEFPWLPVVPKTVTSFAITLSQLLQTSWHSVW